MHDRAERAQAASTSRDHPSRHHLGRDSQRSPDDQKGRIRSRRAVLSCAGALSTGLALALLVGVARTAWHAIQQPGPAAPSDGLLLAVGLAGTALVLWFAAAVLLAALATLPGRVGVACRVLADRLAPAFARRVVAVVLGSTLGAAAVPGSGATAADTDPHSAARAQRIATAVPDPGLAPTPVGEPLPDLVATGARRGAVAAPGASSPSRVPAGAATASRGPGSEPAPTWTPTRPAPAIRSTHGGLGALRSGGMRHVDEHVVVRRGDTLWTVAGRHLGPDATAAQIAAEWPRWYAANRSAIGDDPDLLLPGQRLLPPDAQKATP